MVVVAPAFMATFMAIAVAVVIYHLDFPRRRRLDRKVWSKAARIAIANHGTKRSQRKWG